MHAAAVKGFNAESASLYEKGRPEYPAAALNHIISLINSTKSSSSCSTSIVELGARTGKFTECFTKWISKNQNLGDFSIKATEPSESFRTTLQNKRLPNVSAVYGVGNQIPADSKSVDVCRSHNHDTIL
ncbi:hypothetical protein EON65_01285 [archaeon]|nr:MAG: hypothetical protein EON65_01285 [archaeon]